MYFVHYNGWNKRFDFWARLDSLVKDNDDNTKIAADLETGMYDTRMKGRTIEEVLEAESENEEEMQAEFERKQEQKEIEQQVSKIELMNEIFPETGPQNDQVSAKKLKKWRESFTVNRLTFLVFCLSH